MLEIGSDNVSKTFDEWQTDKNLRWEYPSFRSYLKKIYSSIFD